MNITEIVQSSGWKSFMAKLYGIGASVVIIGALFKIQHWAMASVFLIIGLCTEAIIFFFSAFEPLHEELDWTLVYPELAGMTDPDEIENYNDENVAMRSGDLLERFDQIVESSHLSAETFTKLGDGLSKLNNTASSLNDISQSSAATREYVENFRNAAEILNNMTISYSESTNQLKESVSNLSNSYNDSADLILKSGQGVNEHVAKSGTTFAESYSKLTDSINQYAASISEGNKDYGVQLESLNKNLSAINSVYELQLQNTNEHMKESEKLYSGLDQMMKNLKDSVEETKKYREEINKLSENLSALNSIYGNMLSAMSVVSKK